MHRNTEVLQPAGGMCETCGAVFAVKYPCAIELLIVLIAVVFSRERVRNNRASAECRVTIQTKQINPDCKRSPGIAPSMKNGPVCGFPPRLRGLPWASTPPASIVVVLTVSPDRMCNTGFVEPENKRPYCVGIKTCVSALCTVVSIRFADQVHMVSSRGLHFMLPVMESPEISPRNSPKGFPSGRVASRIREFPRIIPSSFSSLRLPETLSPCAFNTTTALDASFPNRNSWKFHSPVTL